MTNQLSFDELLDYLDNEESAFVLDSVATHGFFDCDRYWASTA